MAARKPAATPANPRAIVPVRMDFTKATPHTYRYDAIDPDLAPVRALYVMKSAFPADMIPPTISVHVEW